MVTITVFIEGDNANLNEDASTFSIGSSFRESFHILFEKIFDLSDKKLVVEPYGTITQTRCILKNQKEVNYSYFLIDLDSPKSTRTERLSYYPEESRQSIFFMIQEMEAWILSQPEKIDEFGRKKGFIRKRGDEQISANPLIKNIHPENIEKPSDRLDTLFRQYFDEKKNGKFKGKHYSKLKDGTELIAILDPSILYQVFDEFKNLVDNINIVNR